MKIKKIIYPPIDKIPSRGIQYFWRSAMDNNCCKKKTKRSVSEKKLITNRLNRIGGQISGITKMIENDAYCNDVLIQLSAVENSIKSLSTHI